MNNNAKAIIFASLAIAAANFKISASSLLFQNPCGGSGVEKSVELPSGSCLLLAADENVSQIEFVSLIFNEKPETFSIWIEENTTKDVLFGVVRTTPFIDEDIASGEIVPFSVALGNGGVVIQPLTSLLKIMGGNVLLRKFKGGDNLPNPIVFLNEVISKDTHIGQELLGYRKQMSSLNAEFCASFYKKAGVKIGDISVVAAGQFSHKSAKDILKGNEPEILLSSVSQPVAPSKSFSRWWNPFIDFISSCVLI